MLINKGKTVLLLLFGALLFVGVSFADSLEIENNQLERSFDEDQLRELRREYIYDRQPPQDLSFIDSFFHWLDKLFSRSVEPIENNTNYLDDIWQVIVILGIGVALLVIILNLVQVKISRLFSSANEKPTVLYSEIEENIKELDLSALLSEAIENNNHRLVIRYYYLIILQDLDSRNLIEWKQDKTNAQYIKELKDAVLKEHFRKATYIFDHVWYGDVKLNEEKYGMLQDTMLKLNRELKGG